MESRRFEILNVIITILIFVIACFVGKYFMDRYNTWLSFNGPAIGVIVVGEIVWWLIRKRLRERE